MKRTLMVLLVGLLLMATTVQAGVVSRIAAVVNDEIITTHQLDLALQQELSQRQGNPTPAQLGALRKELLSRLIEESLMQQRVTQLGLTVEEEELEMALEDVQTQNQLDRDELQEAILAQGMSFDEYRENLRSQIMRYKLIGVEVRRRVEVSDGEIRDYFRAHLDDYRLPPQISLSALVFPVTERAGLAERDAIRNAVQSAAENLEEGAEMAAVAETFGASYGASFTDLGSVAPAELDPDFAEAVEGLEAGAFSRPIEKETAFFLLRVDGRKDAGLRQYYSVAEEIRQHLTEQKTDVRSKEWLKALKQRAFIDIRI